VQLTSTTFGGSHGSLRSFVPRCVVATTALLLAIGFAAKAEPFVPTDDLQVVERLPTPAAGIKRELRTLRDDLAKNPDDLRLAVRLARRYIEIGRTEGDPRYYGYAEALLQPWWRLTTPPVDVLLLRAILKQNRHEFPGALANLSAALAVQPLNAQAWLTRAVILQVTGQYDDARESCARLASLAPTLVSATCIADVSSVSGKAADAYARLSAAVDEAPEADAGLRAWSRSVLAEVAVRAGDPVAAERHYRAALALGIKDVYLLGSYADFLLDHDRPADVRELLAEETRIDPLLLRLALAEAALKAPELAEHVAALQARFATARLRGDTVHRREEARFTLHLLQQPAEALRLAQENWQLQHEAWDARLVLEAALAAGEPDAAADMLAWLKETRLEDPKIAALVAQMTAVSQ
jgi:tetratricopeptide (TPR) repeat protein